MAHFILEYSDNLVRQEGSFDPTGLLGELVEAAVSTGIFPRAGCRGRAHACSDFYVADGRATFGFVHLQVRLGAGRTDVEKDSVQMVLLDVLKRRLASLYDKQGLAISFELVELGKHKANINNIREYLEDP